MLKRIFLTLVFAFAALARATAGDGLENVVWDSVCDLSAPPYGGSATLVGVDGDRGLIVTASHTFHGVGTSRVTVEFRNGYKSKARLLAMDDPNDLALFEIRVQPGMVTPPGVRLARRDHGRVIAVGFPWYGQGKMHFTAGTLASVDGSGRALFAAKPHVHSGYSGGALFDDDGFYLGAISGFEEEPPYLSIAGSGEPLRRLLSRYVEVQE